MSQPTRRDVLKTAVIATTAAAVGGLPPPFSSTASGQEKTSDGAVLDQHVEHFHRLGREVVRDDEPLHVLVERKPLDSDAEHFRRGQRERLALATGQH